MRMSLIERMTAEVDFAERRLHEHERSRLVLQGTASPSDLASFYASVHAAVAHATPLLQRCNEKIVSEGRSPALSQLVREKVLEEAGHEAWVAADMEVIGFALGAPGTPAAAPAAHAYVRTNYNLIDLCGPSFLGTAWILESLSIRCAGLAAKNLQRAGLIPGLRPDSNQGVSFLSLHHDADTRHVRELEQVATLLTDRAAQDYMVLSARLTATLYADFF